MPSAAAPTLRFRKLRIAWSVFWGLACVLLVVLCVRSPYTNDRMSGPLPGSGFLIVSRSDSLGIGIWRRKVDEGWSLQSLPPEEINLPYTTLGFAEYMVDSDLYRLRLKYWFLIVAALAFAAAPWLRCRFSLRTLLIATTLVAVVLGLVVWMSQAG
jgi:hypothetical protein